MAISAEWNWTHHAVVIQKSKLKHLALISAAKPTTSALFCQGFFRNQAALRCFAIAYNDPHHCFLSTCKQNGLFLHSSTFSCWYTGATSLGIQGAALREGYRGSSLSTGGKLAPATEFLGSNTSESVIVNFNFSLPVTELLTPHWGYVWRRHWLHFPFLNGIASFFILVMMCHLLSLLATQPSTTSRT